MPLPLGAITVVWCLKNIMDNIVITGLGVLSSIGIGKRAFYEALGKGKSGVRPITLFDTSKFKAKLAGEIPEFKPQDVLGPKGLRNFDRTTKLLLCAGKLCLEDANLDIDKNNSTSIGVSVGTTLGSLWSISEFDKSALRDGPRFVNPAEFPNTVINSPASNLAIRFGIKGPCATISSGFCSSIDALEYAVNTIRNNRARIMLAGGVEELCVQTFIGFYKSNFLAGITGEELSCPFDKRRNGVIFGEGSVLFTLESEESAIERHAHIYARLGGYGTAFSPYAINKYEPKGTGLKKAISASLNNSGLDASRIDCIISSSNSSYSADLIETKVLQEMLGDYAQDIPITAPKSMLGETFALSGALAVATALFAIEKESIPPTINYKESDSACALDYVPNKPRALRINNALCLSFGPTGCNSCLVVTNSQGGQ